jgi:8-oxo-dGTP pyrophosphatase MutT (NUDIX family)
MLVLITFKERGWGLSSVLEERHVVTAFLTHRGRVLVLKRSGRVGSFQGRWAGVSGYLEGDESPLERALKEIEEETGLGREEVVLEREGAVVAAPDPKRGVVWVVHPFLFRAKHQAIRLDWEHDEARWVRPKELLELETVPKLREALESALGRRLVD